jgi:hypothetical protein
MLFKSAREAGGREAFTNFSIFGIEKDLGGQDMFDPVNVYQVNLNILAGCTSLSTLV